MRALVTGSAGFVGRHMCRELKRRGYEVLGCDINWNVEGLAHRLCADASDVFSQRTTVNDLVVHCAYHVGGRAAIDGTNMNFAKNVQLDSSLFEWAVRTKQKRVLYFSSSAAYPTRLQDGANWGSLSEGGDWGAGRSECPEEADSYYGYAKVVGEALARSARENGLPVTVVRPFSGYGEDQSLDYPFPAIVKRASAGDLSVWGPPGQCRDWIHVDDVVKGALAVVDSGTEEPVNLCTGVATEMGQLARMVWKMAPGANGPPPKVVYDELAPTGVLYRVGNPERMRKYYEPTVSLADGIRRVLSGAC